MTSVQCRDMPNHPERHLTATDRAWIQWGKQDPYFGVCTRQEFRSENIDLHKDEFFRSGEIEIEWLMNILTRLYGSFRRRSAVDFGSGVGRLTIPLSRHFERVFGVDVSPAMIAEAKVNCAQFGVSSVDFLSSMHEFPSGIAKLDLVFSRIVLQHIPPPIGYELVGELLSRLSNGGVASLHVTTHRRQTWARECIYQIKHNLPQSRYLFNVIQNKRWNEPLMQMNNYSLYRLLDIYRLWGMTDIFLEPTTGSSSGFILYGRKGDSGSPEVVRPIA
jgi:SAM-dependent methyltransferase